MVPKLIALSGPAGSGKSEVADYLVNGHGFKKLKFSGPLKAMLSGFYVACGLSEEDIDRRIEGDLKEVPDAYLNGQTPRFAMQTLGTEWGRVYMGSDFWINAWSRRVDNEEHPIVTDDCRFVNEAETVRSLRGSVVEIVPKTARRPASDHVSEQKLPRDLIDTQLHNDACIGTLRGRVDDLLYPPGE